MGARGWKNLIFRAPNDQRWRLILAKVSLPLWIERRIAAVVVKHLKLDLLIPRPIEKPLIDVPIIGADSRLVASAVGVLPLRRADGKQKAEGLFVGHGRLLICSLDVFPPGIIQPDIVGAAVLPVGLNWLPEIVVDPLFVCIAVLDDEGLHTFGMGGGKPEADRRAVVH